MPFFVPALIAGASALAGIMGNRAKKQTQESTSTSTFDRSNMPVYGEKEAIVKDRILNELLSRSEADSDLTGYSALGLGNIAKGQSAKQRALQNMLTSRGLGGGPMAAHAMAGLQGEQIGSQVDFLNSLPMLQRDLRRQSMGDLSQFFSALPVGQRETGTQTTKGTQTTQIPSNPWAGAVSGMGTLASLYGQGAFSKGSPAFTPDNFPTPGAYNPGRPSAPWNINIDPNLGNSFKLPESGDWKYGAGWNPYGE